MQQSEHANLKTNGIGNTSENLTNSNDHMNGELKNHLKMKVNRIIVDKFVERLRIRTVPYIRPLIERLQIAEQKNIEALRSIDKINKRIKEIENFVEKNSLKSKIPKKDLSSIAVGTDLCDPNSQEYNILINSVSSSTLAPVKPRTSQVRPPNVTNNLPDTLNRNNNAINNPPNQDDYRNILFLNQSNTIPVVPSMNFLNAPTNMNHTTVPTNLNSTVTTLLPANNSSQFHQTIESAAMKFLPPGIITTLFSNPKLTWKKVTEGIVLEWNMTLAATSVPTAYQIFSFQKSECTMNNVPWKLVGNTDSLPLPMSCTLNMINRTETYYFILRASLNDLSFSPWSNIVCVDIYGQ